MLGIFDRYILKSFIFFFIASLTVFCVLYLAIDFMNNVSRNPGDFQALISYYTFQTPSVLYQLLPVGFIMGIIFTLTTLNKNNELVALYSSGVSLLRLCAPILVFVAIFSAVTFYAADIFMPKIEQKRDFIYYHFVKQNHGNFQ